MTFPQRLLVLIGVAGLVWLSIHWLRNYFADRHFPERFDRSDVGLNGSGALIVEFTTPYCYECKEALPILKAASVVHSSHLAVVDASDRPDLAVKYGIKTTPTILVVDRKGKVQSGWWTTPSEAELTHALRSAGSSLA